MFASPPRPPRFRLDPNSPEYESSVDLDEDPTQTAMTPVEPFFETTDWTVARPKPLAAPEIPAETAFVDGTQRTLHAGQIESGDSMTSALLASVAVGAVICSAAGARVQYEEPKVHRVLVVGGSVEITALEFRCGSSMLRFSPIYASSQFLSTPRDILGSFRADLERTMAQQLVTHGRLVVVDGRLPWVDSSAVDAPVIGMAKSHHVKWLADTEHQLIGRLQAGERTPIFLIPEQSRARLSWYLRLPHTRVIQHSLAGVVRIETPVVPVEAAIRLADLTAAHLPNFASRPQHDPRAPQNLIPIGALEKQLRHQMGEPTFIRRAIEDHLYREEMQQL